MTQHFRELLERQTNATTETDDVVPNAVNYLPAAVDTGMLSALITAEEVNMTLRKMRNGGMTADRYPIELFKYAYWWDPENKVRVYLLSDTLASIFNAVFTGGLGIPDTWRRSVIVPIYKGKGDRNIMGNYRGISMGCGLYKIYACLLNNRLDSYCNRYNTRSESQFGFRSGMSTISAILALRHAVDKCCGHPNRGGLGKPLTVCFVDFEKAFDRLDRGLIWSKLEQMGVDGSFIKAIKDIYHDTSSVIKVGDRISTDLIKPTVGVKQGCPISPLLFSLVVEDMSSRLNNNVGEDELVQSGLSNHLMFADDTAILAAEASHTQTLVNRMENFCDEKGLKVNVDKTEVVHFHYPRMATQVTTLNYKGVPIKLSDEFVYLGVLMRGKQPAWLPSAEYAAAKANKAIWAAWNRIQALQISNIKMQLTIVKTLVMPIACYGCQVWGVDYLRTDSEHHILNTPTQKVLLFILRLMSGCFSKVSRWNLLREFGIVPIQVHFLKCVIRLWNKGLDSTSTVRKTLLSDIALFCAGSNTCWTSKLFNCLTNLDAVGGLNINGLRNMQPEQLCRFRFNEKTLVESMTNKYSFFQPDMHQCPRNCASRGAIRVKYENWFYNPTNRLLKAFVPISLAQTLMRFKLSSTQLLCYSHGIPRNDRHCFACDSGVIEDELHLTFECVKYRHIREDPKWIELFSVSNTITDRNLKMNCFFNQENQYKLSCFIFCIVSQRNRYLRFGVPNEVEVDMFDSD
jgi:hypothetical protein